MLKRYAALLLFLSFSLTANSRSGETDHWEMLVNSSDTFNYITSNDGEADHAWRSPEFDDASWHSGPGGIGYGDDDDATVIEPCISVFMRRTFSIEDKSILTEGYFYIDYDDAFVAYINGVEIARSAGLTEAYPTSLVRSSAQHEAGQREAYHVPGALLEQIMVTGQNVLAVQVHNATSTSSDLSSSAWLLTGISTTANTYRAVPDWFAPPVPFTSSNLPIVIIHTENNMTIPDEPKIPGYMGIIWNGEGQRNQRDDPHNAYSGHIGIELRGNSTQGFPKKPYSFETRDSLGANRNISVLGLPPENDWVLRASYMDHTFIRNGLANYMSRENGFWASRTRLVEVVLNGKYQGIYILMEKLKRDYWRLNISELYPFEITEPEITGGYIWEITGFGSNMGKSRKLKYPKIELVAPEQIGYITSYDDTFREVMASGNFSDSTTGYHAYINPESFVNEILIQEAMRNSDAYGWSGYYHKDRLGKINAGPVWDFDQSAGNSSYPDNGIVEGWMFAHQGTSNTPFYWKKLFSDPVFSFAVRHRWETLREGPYSDMNLLGYIDSIADLLGEAQQREFNQWPVLATYIWRETTGYDYRDTYQKEVDYLKSFLIRRWQWMDNELAQYENPYPNADTTTTASTTFALGAPEDRMLVYPNPVRNQVTFRFQDSGPGSFSLTLYNHLGEIIVQHSEIPAFDPEQGYTLQLGSEIRSGVYFYRIVTEGNRHFNGRIIKIE